MSLTSMQALQLWRGAIVASVRRDAPDLSARQMALLLSVYLTSPPHTVRGMAAALGASKPAITRAVDRLQALELIRRKPDADDGRSILLTRTVAGSVFLSEFGELIRRAAGEATAS